MRSARCSTNHIVGNWHGPYESSESRPSKRFWSVFVCSRVNAAPRRRSTSCRAATASDAFLSGCTSVRIARWMSAGMSAEKRARRTRSRGRRLVQTSITSKPMASPSRSQSSQRMSSSHPATACCSCASRSFFSSGTPMKTGASKSSTGSHEPHLRWPSPKSSSIRWPVTDVIVIWHCPPSSAVVKSHSALYFAGPLRRDGLPPERIAASSFATEGFSATDSTFFGIGAGGGPSARPRCRQRSTAGSAPAERAISRRSAISRPTAAVALA